MSLNVDFSNFKFVIMKNYSLVFLSYNGVGGGGGGIPFLKSDGGGGGGSY